MRISYAVVFTGIIIAAALAAAQGRRSCPYIVQGDLNNDCIVNLADLSVIASNWMIDCNDTPLNPACLPKPESLLIQEQLDQLHAIEIGLELFRNNFGTYPPSYENEFSVDSSGNSLGMIPYCGSNKLAEAMLGMDMLGFHPRSEFRADGCICSSSGGNYVYDSNDPQNIDERIDLLVDFQIANAYMMSDVYNADIQSSGTSLVLCDVFEKKRPSGKVTGMPILYYRANSKYLTQDFTDQMGTEDDVYNYYDNKNLLDLGSMLWMEQNALNHPMAGGSPEGLEVFEQMIINKQILDMTGIKKPYRPNTFILISAGPDGLYGTQDDITNFQ